MAFDGSGNFNRTYTWTADAAAGTKILASRHDTHDQDLANGLSNTIAKDGQSSPTADIPFNAKKITNLGAPVNPTDAATKGYADGVRNFASAISITGSTPESRLKYTGATGPWGDSYVTADLAFGVRGTDWVWNDKADFTGVDLMKLIETGNLQIAGGTFIGAADTALATSAVGNIYLRPNGSGSAVNQLSLDNGGHLIAVKMTASTGAGNVYAQINCPASGTANGYQKLHSGIIVQWGYVSAGNEVFVTLPLAFPSACASVAASSVGASLPTTSLVAPAIDTIGPTGFTIRGRYVNNGGGVGVASQPVYWIAVGY